MPSPHLLTSIGANDVLNIDPALAAPFLNVGHTVSGPKLSAIYAGVGINAVPYTDINHYLPGDKAVTNATLSMDDVAKTCDGQYVEWVKPDHSQMYLTDPRLPGTLAAWETWYTKFVAMGGSAWAIFEDTANNPFADAVPAPPCNAAGTDIVTQDEWTAASQAKEGAMQAFTGKPVIFNGLAPGYNKRLPVANALLDGPVAGGEAEVCAPSNITEWLNQITIEIHAVKNQKYFVCHGEDASDGSTPQAIAYRQFQFTTMMLEYDITRTIYESSYAVGPSNLRVQPESEVVMLSPFKVTVDLPTDLLNTGGTYARRYHTCYVAGVLVSECAAIVNPNSTVATFPIPLRYHHTMLLQGSGVYDGGTVSALGPPPTSTLAPYTGEVAFL